MQKNGKITTYLSLTSPFPTQNGKKCSNLRAVRLSFFAMKKLAMFPPCETENSDIFLHFLAMGLEILAEVTKKKIKAIKTELG